MRNIFRSKLLILVLLPTIAILAKVEASTQPSKPDPAVLLNPGKRVIFAPGCYGRTDKPHISTHVPGTVNVVSTTFCPGEMVEVTTQLWRDHWIFFKTKKKITKRGFGSVTVNVALPCIWKPGHPKILYYVLSDHSDDHGNRGGTDWKVSLDC